MSARMRINRELSMAQRAALESVVAAAQADPGAFVLLAGGAGAAGAKAAETLASQLGTIVYRIDLAALVSKYLGETEKQLDRMLAEAEAAGAVLLADEADALFGGRTEVEDSHDRYANIETNDLLARLEAHKGIVILATNSTTTIDVPTLRRPLRVVDGARG
jgi:SpoVK/Ycf46/Vps4 family AAA+-type ATPase